MLKKFSLLAVFSLLFSSFLSAFYSPVLKVNDSSTAVIIHKKINSEFFNSNLDSVFVYNKKLLDFATKNNNRLWQGRAFQNYGKLYALQGNNSIALDYYQKSYEVGQKIDNALLIANSKMEMGYIYSKQGKVDLALDYLEQSYKQFEELGNAKGAMTSMLDMAIIYGENNNLPVARKYCKKIVNTVRERELDFKLGSTLLIFALQYVESNADTSFILLDQASALMREMQDTIGLIDVKRAKAQIYRSQKRIDVALPLYLEVIDAKQAIGSSDGLPDLFCKVAEIQWQNNEKEKALKNMLIAEMQLPMANDIEEVLAVYQLLAQFYRENGDSITALIYQKKYLAANDQLNVEREKELSQKDKFSDNLGESADRLVEVAQLAEEKKNPNQSKMGLLYIGGIAVLVGLISLAFYRRRGNKSS